MVRRLLVALVVVCAACNALVGYDDLEKTPTPPAGGQGGGGQTDDDDDTSADSGRNTSSSSSGSSGPGVDSGPTARCNPSKPFGAPTLVQAFDGAGTALSIQARLTRDELEAFWVGSGNSLRSAKRAAVTDPWGPAATTTLNPKFLLLQAITQDGNKLYYLPDTTTFETRFVTRTDRGAAWSAPGTKLVEPNASDNVFYANGDDLVFMDILPTTPAGETNLFTAPLASGQISMAFTPLSATDQPGVNEWHPVVNASLTHLYFLRGEEPNAKVFVSHRASKKDPWGVPAEEPALNGGDGDAPTWVSDDDCVIYLERSNKTFSAVRPPT